jgi:hypothetical protein
VALLAGPLDELKDEDAALSSPSSSLQCMSSPDADVISRLFDDGIDNNNYTTDLDNL